ncbi:hypothetical protein J26TS2_30470 [Shouchella clausii]|nr:hypothetical protein J26TS2_30470 [Shouchella clausii]
MNETFTIQLTEDEVALTLFSLAATLHGYEKAVSDGHQLTLEERLLREHVKEYKEKLSSIYYKGEQE